MVEMETRNNVKSVFDKYADQYNQSRRKLIPCFDDFYKTSIEVIPFRHDENIKILDLGAGTGLLSCFVASAFQRADITLIDVSGNMISQARSGLAKFPNKCEYVVGDYSVLEFSQKFDVIISALSIHHLSGEQKKALFSNIIDQLNPGGVFINADQVQGETPELERVYCQKWLQQVRENGTSERELEAAQERMKEDQMSTLSSQIQWLKKAGFNDVDCWYKNFSFAVFGGRRRMELEE